MMSSETFPSTAAAPPATTEIRASSLPIYNDCARRTAALELLREEIVGAGFKLFKPRPGVGSAIGTAVDAGATLLLKLKLMEVPALVAVKPYIEDAVTAAIQAFRSDIADGCEYDKITPTANIAEKQIRCMVRLYYDQVWPAAEPESVQPELRGDLHNGFELVGHWDWRSVHAQLRDTKTGQRSWPVSAQLGAYVLLGRANDVSIETAAVDFIERVPPDKPQPPVETIAFDVELARHQAVATIRRVKRDIIAFRETGDIEAIPANPFSQFCSNKHCPARGTEFCHSWVR